MCERWFQCFVRTATSVWRAGPITGRATGICATVSWDEEFESRDQTPALIVPCMADVLETILVGSARNPDSLTAEQEFDLYRRVVHELIRRLDELQACHD